MKSGFLQSAWFLKFIIIPLISLAAYANSFQGQLQFDDKEYIEEDTYIKRGINIVDIYQYLQTPDLQSRIIGFWTFAVNHRLDGIKPFGYHLVNWMIHTINGMLVFWLVRLILHSPQINLKNSRLTSNELALIAALIFITHPLQTQAVSYISQRFASLATLFYLLSVCSFFTGHLNHQKRWYVVAIVSGILGMFTKQIVFTLPIMIAIIQMYCFPKENRSSTFKWIRIGGFIGGFLILPFLFRHELIKFLARTMPSESHNGEMINMGSYILAQLQVIPVYWRLVFFPIGQNLDYDFSIFAQGWEWKAIVGACLILTIIYLAWVFRKKFPLISLGLTWMLVAMAVESSMIPIRHVIFEHRMYLPMVGIGICLSAFIGQLPWPKSTQLVLATIVIILFGILTFQRNIVWATEIAMWQDVVQKSPNKPRGYLSLGKAYYEAGDHPKANEYLLKAISLDPQESKTYNNLGLLYKDMGQVDQAIEYYSKAIELEPQFSKAFNNRGLSYKALGKFDLALNDYNEALKYEPGYAAAMGNRGVIFAMLNRCDLAVTDFTQAMRMNSDYYQLYNNRGFCYLFLKEYSQALHDLNRSIELKSDYGISYLHRSKAYVAMGRFQDAFHDIHKAQKFGAEVESEYYQMVKRRLEGAR